MIIDVGRHTILKLKAWGITDRGPGIPGRTIRWDPLNSKDASDEMNDILAQAGRWVVVFRQHGLGHHRVARQARRMPMVSPGNSPCLGSSMAMENVAFGLTHGPLDNGHGGIIGAC